MTNTLVYNNQCSTLVATPNSTEPRKSPYYNEYQDLVDVLGSLSSPWQFDVMLNLIDEHVTNQVKTVPLGNVGLRTELLHESIPFCSCNVTITQMWEYLKDMLPSAYHRDIDFMTPLR